jgi:hypothetical protein
LSHSHVLRALSGKNESLFHFRFQTCPERSRRISDFRLQISDLDWSSFKSKI